MARIRSIKPELLQDEKTASLKNDTWRLFVSMIVMADDYGNLHASPKRLLADAFWAQRRGAMVERMLAELVDVGLVVLYDVGGQQFAHLTGWAKHQKISHPGRPSCPGPEQGTHVSPRDGGATGARRGRDGGATGARSGDDQGECEPKEIKQLAQVLPEANRTDRDRDQDRDQDPPKPPKGGVVVPLPANDSERRETSRGRRESDGLIEALVVIGEHYRKYHPHAFKAGIAVESKAAKLIRERLKEGSTAEDICTAIDGYHVSPHHCGKNDSNTVYQALTLIARDQDHVVAGIGYAKRFGKSRIVGGAIAAKAATGVSYTQRQANLDALFELEEAKRQ